MFRKTFQSQHALICQRHVKEHYKVSPRAKWYKIIHGHKYVTAYESLTHKNAGARKRNMIHVEQNCLSVCVRIIVTKYEIFSSYSYKNFTWNFVAARRSRTAGLEWNGWSRLDSRVGFERECHYFLEVKETQKKSLSAYFLLLILELDISQMIDAKHLITQPIHHFVFHNNRNLLEFTTILLSFGFQIYLCIFITVKEWNA